MGTTSDGANRVNRFNHAAHPPPPPPLAFIPPMLFLRRLRRAATVVAASTALTLFPQTHRPRAVHAATPTPVVLFDRSYTGAGSSNLWNDLGVSVPQPPVAPLLKSTRKRILVEDELRILMRLVVAATVGGIIGMERRSAKSFAGVRTFSLVSLGAAIFLSTCLVACPQADPARIAAAISSSVGFIGGGVMSKNSKHSRGLTTATSVWLAAGLGVAAASGLFVLAYVGAVMTVLIARYARFDSSLHLIRGDPLARYDDDDDDDDDDHDDLLSPPRRPPPPRLNEKGLEEQSYSGNGSPTEIGRRGSSPS